MVVPHIPDMDKHHMSDFDIRNAAQAAAQRSIDTVRAKDKDGWVANFADDACIEDPVGKSPLDQTGNGPSQV